jgi:REP element-mobilizing transposase RayT
MARRTRIQFPGAIYHVTSRGDRQEPIFDDTHDRTLLLDVLAAAAARYDFSVLAYCLMGNHYHFILCTHEPNLADAMHYVNGVYTQKFNRRHGTCGHVFQGRYYANLVDRDEYLIASCRYVELNPVRACLVQNPEDWAWSSYRAHIGIAHRPVWLRHSLFEDVGSTADHRRHAHTVAEA